MSDAVKLEVTPEEYFLIRTQQAIRALEKSSAAFRRYERYRDRDMAMSAYVDGRISWLSKRDVGQELDLSNNMMNIDYHIVEVEAHLASLQKARKIFVGSKKDYKKIAKKGGQ